MKKMIVVVSLCVSPAEMCVLISVLPEVTSGWQLWRCVKAGVLPFLRAAALFFHYLNSTAPPADLLGNNTQHIHTHNDTQTHTGLQCLKHPLLLVKIVMTVCSLQVKPADTTQG